LPPVNYLIIGSRSSSKSCFSLLFRWKGSLRDLPHLLGGPRFCTSPSIWEALFLLSFQAPPPPHRVALLLLFCTPPHEVPLEVAFDDSFDGHPPARRGNPDCGPQAIFSLDLFPPFPDPRWPVASACFFWGLLHAFSPHLTFKGVTLRSRLCSTLFLGTHDTWFFFQFEWFLLGRQRTVTFFVFPLSS